MIESTRTTIDFGSRILSAEFAGPKGQVRRLNDQTVYTSKQVLTTDRVLEHTIQSLRSVEEQSAAIEEMLSGMLSLSQNILDGRTGVLTNEQVMLRET